MTAPQDISSQLMKSPRELASWTFPLSQILEDYFNLLPEPCKIHYGEAALVIQNSVNAYVCKVEDLYDEARCFNQKLFIQSNEKEKRNLQKLRTVKTNLLDFSEFELIDFDKERGKNINFKSHDKKSIKFLHRCFSQLENSHARLCVEVFDVQGDVVGKKYDFRCNQQMSKIGILVEEIAPIDFGIINAHRYEPTSFSKMTKKSVRFDGPNYIFNELTDKSKLNTNNNLAESEEMASDIVQFDQITESSGSSFAEVSSCFSQIESFPISKEVELCISKFPIEDILQDNYGCEDNNGNVKKCTHYINTYGEDFCHSKLQIQNEGSKNNLSPMDIDGNEAKNTINMSELVRNEVKTASKSLVESNAEETDNFKNIDHKRKRNEENMITSTESENVIDQTRRRSKRYKQTTLEADNSNLNNLKLFEPIPFEDGIPEKLVKRRNEFRLPCHINLLKYFPFQRKKKSTKGKMKISLQFNQMPRSNKSPKKSNIQSSKMTVYSPSRLQLTRMKEEDQKGFRRYLEESFSIKRHFSINYEPVTTSTMDLLGFEANYEKNDSHLDFSGRTLKPLSERNILPCIEECTIEYATILSPSYNERPRLSPSHLKIFVPSQKDEHRKDQTHVKCGQDFEKIVKCKIKKIYKELDLHTDEDQKIAKWHEEIKPRLIEAERKPPFRIHEYASRILQLFETSHKKLQFDEIVREEPPCEIARYFSAILQLANTNNVDINTGTDPKKSIELILLD